MNTSIEKIDTSEIFAASFEQQKNYFSENNFMKNIRAKAMESFLKQGFPTKKSEEFKYSPPEKLFFKDAFETQLPSIKLAKKEFEKHFIPDLDTAVIALENGSFSKENSRLKNIPKEVIICDFSEAITKHSEIFEKHFSKYAAFDSDAFVALNTAFTTNGLFIYIPENFISKNNFHIINLVTTQKNAFCNHRNLFLIGKNAEIKIIETIDTVDLPVKIITNSVTEILVSENAKLHYYTLQNECENGNRINATHVSQQANSHFDTNTITLGGSWIRNDLNIALNAEKCETHLNGLFITKGNQHVDNHTLVDHKYANCESRQLYKGILDEKSTGVFNGKIMVRKDAQKTNAYQSSKNILLSDDATINAKPQLEIYADDVKCSHGTSTGKIDENALFYLRSRGISESSAQKLLLHAFAIDVSETLKIPALKTYVENLIEAKLYEI